MNIKSATYDSTVGVVVIGRNEGERLKTCLNSLHGSVDLMVYVDSGSNDGSVEFARSLNIDVLNLDLSKPFTMARGRNEGFKRLYELKPELDYVQFVDGDCEVLDGWIDFARKTLDENPQMAAVAGMRKERQPDVSIYNRLCEMDWNGSCGIVRSTGGDVMMRMQPLNDSHGFNEGMIAGEEGELMLRLRHMGWQICRQPQSMTLHDASMFSFAQWWKRTIRTGHAYAEGMYMHRCNPQNIERYNLRQVISCLVWGIGMPLVTLSCLITAFYWSWALTGVAMVLLLTFVTWSRIVRKSLVKTNSFAHSALFSTFCLLGKIPEAIGVAWFAGNCIRGRRSLLIEYKTSSI